MADDHAKAKPTLEDRVQRLEIGSLYRSVTHRLIQIYDEQREHATASRPQDSVHPLVAEQVVPGAEPAFWVHEAAHGSRDHGTHCNTSFESKKRSRSVETTSPGPASRLIRFREAPRYLGMDRNRFNAEVRPYLTEIPIGRQGVAFDRLDLDAWAGEYKSRNGRPGKQKGAKRLWDATRHAVSSTAKVSGTSTKLSEEEEFAKALARANSRKRKSSSAAD